MTGVVLLVTYMYHYDGRQLQISYAFIVDNSNNLTSVLHLKQEIS